MGLPGVQETVFWLLQRIAAQLPGHLLDRAAAVERWPIISAMPMVATPLSKEQILPELTARQGRTPARNFNAPLDRGPGLRAVDR